MPSMSTIDSQGRRVGATDLLHTNRMDIGSKVFHGSSEGVYEIEEAQPSDGAPVVKLKLCHKCVNMQQLWALQADDFTRSAGRAIDVAEAMAPAPTVPLNLSTQKASLATPPASLSRFAPGLRPKLRPLRPQLVAMRWQSRNKSKAKERSN